jgi:isoleucyl-tRNA synthetase
VLDHLHRCLTAWLAPVLVFTAEEAFAARNGGTDSIHMQTYPELPASWRDEALGRRWARIREIRRLGTTVLEKMREQGRIGASLQAAASVVLSPADPALPAEQWAELLIVSGATVGFAATAEVTADLAEGLKCARCWRVLPEVGADRDHQALCLRCVDAVASGLVCQGAA